jgi:CheY-like chemotaxis protein/anti-sigma regulatory factor (Ser/Thr protein kinase)
VLELPEHLPCAKADANQLEMALLNLVLNSRDAMPEGGTLSIIASCAPLKNGPSLCDVVELSVTDTGIGMDEQTLARAVEPFFSTKGVGRGTGLGLSMVHGLQAQLGGELLVESEPGRGTTIRLRFETVDLAAVKDKSAPKTKTLSGAGTVLLVDDEDLVRASTAEMLSDMGYVVVQEPSAESALLRLSAGLNPSILVTDHLMPGMTGTDLARAARELLPQLPVLIISGYAELEGITSDLPRLTKPFRQAELESHLATMQSAT